MIFLSCLFIWWRYSLRLLSVTKKKKIQNTCTTYFDVRLLTLCKSDVMMPIQRNRCDRGECPTRYISIVVFVVIVVVVVADAAAAATTFVYDIIAQQPNNIVTIIPTTRYYHCPIVNAAIVIHTPLCPLSSSQCLTQNEVKIYCNI